MSSQVSLSSDEVDDRCVEPRQANQTEEKKPLTPGREKLQSWLDKSLRIVMTDSRILVGDFLCTDRAGNVILGMCYEYTDEAAEGRYLGSVMVPGKHIVKMEVDTSGKAPSYRASNKMAYDQQQQIN
ncbi:N-alpha-acetyltransferase 38, NatC auxiliary subunit [Culicoides brevitarsis]|uniref:N-alpha-acetyltransferase 38, NatC auxiliary subunit n=1 Tax=Culicoides brevitarsis TaxID=469753 RepID=UPI00307B9979